MEKLSIRHNTHILLRKILGIITIICGTTYIIIAFQEHKAIYIISAALWTSLGVLYIISSQESNSSVIEPGDGFIRIRWMNWLKSVAIADEDIEKITLARLNVRIDRKGKKQVKLPLDFFETAQKKEVYLYIIELCKIRNLTLENTL